MATLVALRLSVSLATIDVALLGRWCRATPPEKVPKILVLTVPPEDVDIHEKMRPPKCSCPLIPRSLIARAVDRLDQAHAAAIILDFIFDRSCPVHDGALSAAMKRAGNVVAATSALVRDDRLELIEPVSTVTGYKALASPAVYAPHGTVLAVETVQGASFKAIQTPEGPLTVVSDYCLPLALGAWCVMNGVSVDDVSIQSADRVLVGSMSIPVVDHVPVNLLSPLLPPLGPEQGYHAMPVRWWGPRNTFPVLTFSELLAGAVPPERLRDAVVILGERREQRRTPLGAMSGPEVQANIVATVMTKRWFQPLSPYAHWAITFAAAFLAALAMTLVPSVGGVAAAGAVAVLAVLVSRELVAADRWLLVAPVLLGVAFSATTAMVANQLRGHRARRWLAREVEMRDQVASEVAHDMRGHLAALAQTMDLVLRRLSRYSDEAVDPRALDVLRRQLRSLEHEVSTLLDADPDRQMHARRTPVNMLELVRNTAEDVQASTHGHTVRVTGTPATVAGDQSMLARAVWNLLNNAVKYSPQGGEVRVRVESSNGMVSVAISDDGIGLRQEDLPKLFTRFGRAVPEGMSIPGTGLGLYSVQRAAQAHHGRVTVESRVDVGSTFTIWLPAQRPLSEELPEDEQRKPT
jgi:signal transduction histidine kinase